ncbi:sulfur carrier protein ThiS [Streptomyces sp. I05A-00742]|uniref:sulfur carrier protein ThiS n=1 Tax=Streptomyces sp. I05A-00742 TaxID=2732853 RepID=UPI00148957E4|nr:sulfur carrier protein ThiS [Streptomyces sp. I05A-00742]
MTGSDVVTPGSPGAAPGVSVHVNGEPRAVPRGTTLAALVAELAGSAGRPGAPGGVAAAVNEAVVPRGRWADTPLRDGDRVEVLTAVQGG